MNSVIILIVAMLALNGCAGLETSTRYEIKGPLMDSSGATVKPVDRDPKIDDIKIEVDALRYKLDNKSYGQ